MMSASPGRCDSFAQVVVLAIDESDEVGVLLDLARVVRDDAVVGEPVGGAWTVRS